MIRYPAKTVFVLDSAFEVTGGTLNRSADKHKLSFRLYTAFKCWQGQKHPGNLS